MHGKPTLEFFFKLAMHLLYTLTVHQSKRNLHKPHTEVQQIHGDDNLINLDTRCHKKIKVPDRLKAPEWMWP